MSHLADQDALLVVLLDDDLQVDHVLPHLPGLVIYAVYLAQHTTESPESRRAAAPDGLSAALSVLPAAGAIAFYQRIFVRCLFKRLPS